MIRSSWCLNRRKLVQRSTKRPVDLLTNSRSRMFQEDRPLFTCLTDDCRSRAPQCTFTNPLTFHPNQLFLVLSGSFSLSLFWLSPSWLSLSRCLILATFWLSLSSDQSLSKIYIVASFELLSGLRTPLKTWSSIERIVAYQIAKFGFLSLNSQFWIIKFFLSSIFSDCGDCEPNWTGIWTPTILKATREKFQRWAEFWC